MNYTKNLNHFKRSTLTITSTFMMLLLGLPVTQTVNAAAAGTDELPYAESIDKHFHPKGKPPSEHTLAVRAQQAANLPFSDERDLEEQARGFIAAPSYTQIMADAGHVAWDMGK